MSKIKTKTNLRQHSSPAFFFRRDENLNNLASSADEPLLGFCHEHCPSSGHTSVQKEKWLARQKSFDYYLHPTERKDLIQLKVRNPIGNCRPTLKTTDPLKVSADNDQQFVSQDKRKISNLRPIQEQNPNPTEISDIQIFEDEEGESLQHGLPLLLAAGEKGCNNLKASKATPEDIFVETEAATRSDMTPTSEVLKCGLQFWRTWVVIVVPLIALPILFQGQENQEQKAFKCAYVMLIMATFWVTEALPLAITSLLPVALLPLLGIMSTDAVGREYLKETNMMFISGVIVAIAVEHSNLHKRVALKVLLLIGTSPRRLMLGFMLPTLFLSMWISNTATTAMMVPIVDAVLSELEREELKDGDDKRSEKIRHMIFLSIAYAANTGGTGTLTGTGSNLILKASLDDYGPGNPINFASWMQYAVIPMLINFILCWLWLQVWYLGLPNLKFWKNNSGTEATTTTTTATNKVTAKRSSGKCAAREVIQQQYRTLGPITFHEVSVFILFCILILLWFFREPQFIPGWGDFFKTIEVEYIKIDENCHSSNCTYVRLIEDEAEAVDDATAGMIIVILLFILPSQLHFWPFVSGPESKPSQSLLTWEAIHRKMPWSLVLLLGGGFALAKASTVSGLSAMMGHQLETLGDLPNWVIVLLVCMITAAATEVTSNVATCSILLPVLKNLAVSLRIHPLYLLLPVTLSCSYAFMLPVATPPNAIVYSASGMKTTEMMKLGFGMNLIGIGVNLLWLHSYGTYFFQLDTFPQWAVKGLSDAFQ